METGEEVSGLNSGVVDVGDEVVSGDSSVGSNEDLA